MPADLAPVYLDDTRVTLQGDPRPKVAKILQAGGRPTDSRVVRVDGLSSVQALGPDEVIDRTGDTRPVHLRTAPATAASPSWPAQAAPVAGDEGVGGVGGQGGFANATPGKVEAPGDILRGTETRADPAHPSAAKPGVSSEEEARVGLPSRSAASGPGPGGSGGNPREAQRFAESQSFGDPVHKGGSPRIARGARPSSQPPGRIPDGGLRTQETGHEEGAHTPRRPSTTTTSRESLARTTEEE